MLGKRIAIDLGTATTRVAVKGEPGVTAEPTAVALSQRGDLEGFGSAAWTAPVPSMVVRPLVGRAVADPVALGMLLQQVVTRAAGRQRIFKPDVMLAVGATLAGDSRRHVLDVCMNAGARTVFLLDSSLAAAIGSGRIDGPRGRLTVDVGAGGAEVCTLAQEGCVARATAGGSAALTAAVGEAVRRRHGVILDEGVADEVKRELCSALPLHEERTLTVPARTAAGDGVEVSVSSRDVEEATRSWLDGLDGAIRSVREETPPILHADLADGRGTLTGAGAWLNGLERHLSQVAGVPLRVAADPDASTLRGCLAALDNLDLLKRNLLYIR